MIYPTFTRSPLRTTGPLEDERFGSFRVPLCVCSDCRYADRFAIQPRAFCRKPDAPLRGSPLAASQPSCEHFAARTGPDLSLHIH